MKYKQLGNSGVRVSELCLGTMNFGSQADESTSIKIVNEALDSGINFIDEADVYAGGVSEEIVGKAISRNGRRNEIVLATKGVAPMGDGQNNWGASRYHLIRACEASLRRLQTDRIDLYYLHIVDMNTPMEEIMAALEILVRQGKILYAGTSKWPSALIVEALSVSKNYRLVQMIAEQPAYNLMDRSIENELLWTCMRNGIGVVTFAPLAGGVLSGRYRKGEEIPKDSRYAKEEMAELRELRLTPKALDAVEKLLPIAKAKNITLSGLGHAWLLQRYGITSIIAGPSNVKHLHSTLGACEIKLTCEELAEIDKIVPSGSAVSNFYDMGTRSHMRKAVNAGDVNAY